MSDKDIVTEAKVLAEQNHRIYGTQLSETLVNLVEDLADEITKLREENGTLQQSIQEWKMSAAFPERRT